MLLSNGTWSTCKINNTSSSRTATSSRLGWTVEHCLKRQRLLMFYHKYTVEKERLLKIYFNDETLKKYLTLIRSIIVLIHINHEYVGVWYFWYSIIQHAKFALFSKSFLLNSSNKCCQKRFQLDQESIWLDLGRESDREFFSTLSH